MYKTWYLYSSSYDMTLHLTWPHQFSFVSCWPCLRTWIIYYTCKCTLLQSVLRFWSISVGCSIRKHTNSQWVHHKDWLVCTDKEQNERHPALSLHLYFPSLSLFIVSSVITSASLLFLFLFIHNSNVTQNCRVCWLSSLHYAIRSLFIGINLTHALMLLFLHQQLYIAFTKSLNTKHS